MDKLNWLALGLFATIIILCNLATYRLISAASRSESAGMESIFLLAVFNIFFISLFSLLSGNALTKGFMLTVGNLIGALWNTLFCYILSAGYSYFGFTFNAAFTIAFPILNILWIVPFWSLSLSVLPKFQPNNQ